MSLFAGETILRHQYADLTGAAINATSGASDALLLCSVQQAARLSFIFNGTAADLTLWLVHPKRSGAIVANRLKWMEMPANYNLNYDVAPVALSFDPDTKIYVSKASGTAVDPTKLRIILWG